MMTCPLQGCPADAARSIGVLAGWAYGFVRADIPKPTDAQIRHALKKVYERPEFSLDGGQSLLAMLGQLLARFFLWLGELSGKNPLLFWILLLSCFALLLLLLVHIVWTVRRV